MQNGHDQHAPNPAQAAINEFAASARQRQANQALVEQLCTQRNAALDQLALAAAENGVLREQLTALNKQTEENDVAIAELRRDLAALNEGAANDGDSNGDQPQP